MLTIIIVSIPNLNKDRPYCDRGNSMYEQIFPFRII